MFTPSTLFKGVSCPMGAECVTLNCIFGHQVPETTSEEPSSKRQKTTHRNTTLNPTNVESPQSITVSDEHRGKNNADARTGITPHPVNPLTSRSLTGHVSRATQPATPQASSTSSPTPGPTRITEARVQETLNPRMVANAPEKHGSRTVLLKHIHTAMTSLNDQARRLFDQGGPNTEHGIDETVLLSGSELITVALDDEEQIATTNGPVYQNVAKNRIGAYRRMTLPDWVNHVKTTTLYEKNYAPVKAAPVNPPRPIDTGLTFPGETVIAKEYLIADQAVLAKNGYVVEPPTKTDIEKAAKGIEMASGYETCAHCLTTFLVFPDRDEKGDGRLTSKGPCTYHPGRKVMPALGKSNRHLTGSGTLEEHWACCQAGMGTVGCTTQEHHVFKRTNPAQLAYTLPFIPTPTNDSPGRDRNRNQVHAVAFDCEMGYTTVGMELIRLTAVSWPEGNELVDTLVRPLGIVLDLNTRFSGVQSLHFAKAIPHAEHSMLLESGKKFDKDTLPVVSSPSAARTLLCSFISPSTPLVGHGLENDLNAVRLCHPTVIDTALLFPHRKGLPFRMSLKLLTERYLGRQIQTGGELGHDSFEDAIAAGDLVRVKVKHQWASVKLSGQWVIEDEMVGIPVRKNGPRKKAESTSSQ